MFKRNSSSFKKHRRTRQQKNPIKFNREIEIIFNIPLFLIDR
jgi:hypothetical protein